MMRQGSTWLYSLQTMRYDVYTHAAGSCIRQTLSKPLIAARECSMYVDMRTMWRSCIYAGRTRTDTSSWLYATRSSRRRSSTRVGYRFQSDMFLCDQRLVAWGTIRISTRASRSRSLNNACTSPIKISWKTAKFPARVIGLGGRSSCPIYSRSKTRKHF